jgi:hypothetical protein
MDRVKAAKEEFTETILLVVRILQTEMIMDKSLLYTFIIIVSLLL